MNLLNESDNELVKRYRQGDQEAIETILERYKNLVRSKARQMYISGGDSDDLIQEGMIGLYKAVRDYNIEKEASFYTFASLCISNQMKTAVTAANRQKNVALNTYVSFDIPAGKDEDSDIKLVDLLLLDHNQNPENLFIEKESLDLIKKRMNEVLSSFEKKVFDLNLEGKDYIEIASILDKTPKSIDNALQRIRTKLARLKKLDK